MNHTTRLWWFLGLMFVVSFGALLFIGADMQRQSPPIPKRVQTPQGQQLYTDHDIRTGRQVWQSIGGHQLGSIWGHGSYVAPDWSADWLHREAIALMDIWSEQRYGQPAAQLNPDTQAMLQARVKRELRHNGYDPNTEMLTISSERAQAIQRVSAHYQRLFSSDPQLETLREQYALPNDTVTDRAHRAALSAFFFWSAWATATNRPDSDITYTNNWPHEPLIDNTPTTGTVVWSFASIILLLAAIGAMVWYYAVNRNHDEEYPKPPTNDPLRGLELTPSMRATTKYFFTVIALFLGQITLGAITAHYAVEGHEFYGLPLAEVLPYSVARTWHTQLGIFWIATAWLATGLYIAPAITRHEPRYQKLGVNVLYIALLIVVTGSLAGEWLGVQQRFSLDVNFWLGHQGYEFVDLGRFWQLLLFVGLLSWVTLVGRALWPALKQPSENRGLITILFLSAIAIGGFYGAGLSWGKHTHLTMVEYWRWWVVHLWVEGFFEVFATAVIALLFTQLGLIRKKLATDAVLFATIVFLFGGILGTLHHLYFAGTPTSVIAVGAVFSALEVVPLVLIGYEAYENYKLSQSARWVQAYKWPIMFFVAVAFWNLVGAGLLGFLINPPLALYYLQGLNTTPTHGHAALFGVYGMLGIGLMLFCLRGLTWRDAWDDSLLQKAFWFLNVGLGAMVFLSLLPAGLYQAWHSITTGLWYARSAEVIHAPLMEIFVWMRVPGDILFSIGVVILAWFTIKLGLRGALIRPAVTTAGIVSRGR